VKGKNPLDIQQKGITPISSVLRAATRIVTMYIVWMQLWYGCGLLYCSVFCKNSHSHSIFVPLSQGHHRSRAGLSSKRGDVPLTLQKLTDTIKTLT